MPIDSRGTMTPGGIASRILGRSKGSTLTLFAFDHRQDLNEHTAPFEPFVTVLDGEFRSVVGGQPTTAAAATINRLPASVPHAVGADGKPHDAVMLREQGPCA